MKRITLCADDYGQNPAISQAIIDLIEKKRLSATSCLTSSPHWLPTANWLEPFKNHIDIGLHFNLTDGVDIAQPVSSWIVKSQLRLIDKDAILAECHDQLDLFEKGMGKLPDFIDGHQHVHQFPIIRDALLEVYESRLRGAGAYIRSTHNPGSWKQPTRVGFLKEGIISLCGAYGFQRKLSESKVPHNHSFSGIYNFEQAENYRILFPRFVDQVENGGLVMCHPGLKGAAYKDPIGKWRGFEYEFLLENEGSTDYILSRFIK